MRILVATIATALTVQIAQAGTLHCSFTEPFFTIDYDSMTGKVVMISPDHFDDEGKMIPETLAEAAKLIAEPDWQDHPTFHLKNGDETILTLKASGNGSDGMSDGNFPFEGIRGKLIGGCETGKIRAWDIYEFQEDFGIPF
jgi:hypothetical protein